MQSHSQFLHTSKMIKQHILSSHTRLVCFLFHDNSILTHGGWVGRFVYSNCGLEQRVVWCYNLLNNRRWRNYYLHDVVCQFVMCHLCLKSVSSAHLARRSAPKLFFPLSWPQSRLLWRQLEAKFLMQVSKELFILVLMIRHLIQVFKQCLNLELVDCAMMIRPWTCS